MVSGKARVMKWVMSLFYRYICARTREWH